MTQKAGPDRVKKDHGNVTAEFQTATHANSGLVACSRYFEGGKKVTLITRPRMDLCQQPRYIPDQCKMLLKLTPNKSSFVLMSDKNGAKYRLKIHSCTLMVRRIKLVEASNLHFNPQLRQIIKSFITLYVM